MTDPVLTKTVRYRKSYEARTKADTRAATTIAKAMFGKGPEFYEDEDGFTVRRWLSSEMSSYSNADIASCLRNRVAVEPGEMLGTIPPSAIKYCVTKGWLLPAASGRLMLVTLRAALELDLPMTFKGGSNHGRKIKFAEPPARKG